MVRVLVNGLVILFHRIPFIDRHNDSLAALMRNPGNLRVLLGHALLGVNNHQDHIGPFNGRHGPDDAVALQLLPDLILPAQPRGVDKHILCPVVYDLRIHRVARRACNIRHDHPVFAQQLIDNRRLAHIRLAHDRDPGAFVLLLFGRILREMGRHRVQKLSQAQARGRRDRNRIPDPKIIKLIDVVAEFLKAVHLIHGQDHRLFRFAQHVRHLGIRVRHALAHIHNKHDHVCGGNRNLRLFPHLGQDNIL